MQCVCWWGSHRQAQPDRRGQHSATKFGPFGGGAPTSGGIGFRGEAYSPEVIQGAERLDADFPKAVGQLLPHPNDAKSRRLLGKSVGERDFGAEFQYPGGADQRSESSDHTGMGAFLQLVPALCNALHLDGNANTHAPTAPAVFRLERFGQARNPFKTANTVGHNLCQIG